MLWWISYISVNIQGCTLSGKAREARKAGKHPVFLKKAGKAGKCYAFSFFTAGKAGFFSITIIIFAWPFLIKVLWFVNYEFYSFI